MPSAAAIPPRGLAIARREATPVSGTVRSARRRHFFSGCKDRPLFYLSSKGTRLFFFSPNLHHEFVFVVTKNDSQGDVFGCGFLVGYWVD